DYRSRVDRAARTALLSALALELIATLSVAVVAVTLGVRLLSGSVALDVALVVLLLAPDCFSALRDIGAAYHQAQDGRSALTRVRALLERQVRSLRRDTGRASLDALRIRHPGRTTIGPVTADLPATGMVAVRGPSGAGKSTLLDAIAGVADPDAEVSGRIVGLPLDELAVARQAPRFFASTPLDELGLVGPEHAGILAELGLEEHGRDPIARLSPGEQRRVAVARALARVDAGARILILDEPTAHLDDASALLTRAAIRRRQDRVLVIVASHDPAVIDGADTIIDLPEPAQEARPQRLAALGSPSSSAAPGQLPERPRRRSGRGVWVGAIALGVVASGMSLALTGVSGWLIVRAAAEPAIMYLLVAIVGVRFFGLGRAVARYAERIVSHRAALQMVDEIRLRVWRVLADRGTAARAARDAGTALDVLVNLPAQLRDLLPRVVTPLASGVLVGMGASVVIVVVAPGAAGIAVLLAATTALAPIAAWLADRRRQVRSVSTGSAMIRRFGALAASAADLRADGIAPAAVDRIDGIGRTLEREERSQSVVTASAGILAVVGTGAAAVLAPLFVGAPEIAAVVALLCLACLEPIAAAATGAQRIPALVAVARRLTAATTAPARAGGRRTAAVGPVERLTVDDLALAWEPGHPVFDHLDARIDADAWTVVDGPSGSGKTTLVAALLGDLDPAAGSIDVDGTDLALIQRDRWSTRISWCPQEAHVFDSTLRANLLLARPRTDPVTDDEAIAALEAVGLSRFAGPTGAGLGVRVGPRGSFLSGGERQRVAVARALLRRGDVVVLDEPTAHLDAPTAELMMDDVRRATAGRIVILVSHRDADRRPEDRIIRLGRSLAAVG
ncbi:MAG TPA: thiol reductant ABC exporter subunit CydC, partial [Pseudolysinimonas sp.]|nr:thiol reductant ABC exporter subunit CydC [Pseudolysinimonas sp.]